VTPACRSVASHPSGVRSSRPIVYRAEALAVIAQDIACVTNVKLSVGGVLDFAGSASGGTMTSHPGVISRA
jgi:hypothetical protein